MGRNKLDDFPFRHLLFAMALDNSDDKQKNRALTHLPPLEYIAEAEFIRCRVWPDSQSSDRRREFTEHLSGPRKIKMSFDVCVAAEMEVNGEHSRILFLCENKVKAVESEDQTVNYAKYALDDDQRDSRDRHLFGEAECTRANKLYRALLFLSPDAGGIESQGRRAMSPDFITFNYQKLVDDLLDPCSKHPSLSSQGSEIIKEYLRNLASAMSDTGHDRIAISPAERKSVEDIKDKEEHYKILNLLTQIREDDEDTPETDGGSYGTPLVSVIDLIVAKLLREGDRLIYKRGDVEKEVEVVAGGIKVNDHVFKAPSSAAKEILGGQVCRGWDRFKVITPGSDNFDKSLLELREQFRSTTVASVPATPTPCTALDTKFIAFAKAVMKTHRKTFKVIEEIIQDTEDFAIPLISDGGRVGKVTLSELVEHGLISDGEPLYFFHKKKFEQEQAIIDSTSNRLRYEGDSYSISELAKILLIKHKFKTDDHGVAGPLYWQTKRGRRLQDLNETVREKSGERTT